MVNIRGLYITSVLTGVATAQLTLSSTTFSFNGTNSTTSTTTSRTTTLPPVTTPSITTTRPSTSVTTPSFTSISPSRSSSAPSTTPTPPVFVVPVSSGTVVPSSSPLVSAASRPISSSLVVSSSSVKSSSETKPTVTTPSISPSPSSTSPTVSSASTIPPSSDASVKSSSATGSRSSVASSSASRSSPETFVYSSVSSSVSFQVTVYSTAAVIITTQPDGQTSQRTEYTLVQTSIPALTVYATTVVTSTESPTGIAGLQVNSISTSSNSLSTGAKAGIGAGVAVAVIAAAIIGALFAMRRRRRNHAIADSDRYTPSLGPSTLGGFGTIGKAYSSYTGSEMRGAHSPSMRESNPLDRYASPTMISNRTSLPGQSRVSDVSSMSGSDPPTYRPGPGMPAVAENSRPKVEQLPEQNTHLTPDYAAVGINPFHTRHTSSDQTPSLYSHDGDDQSNTHPALRQTSPTALELSTGNAQGYRGTDQEQPYHTRAQLMKPMIQQGRYDVAHNF